jgi:hypothetical protein
MAKRNRSDDRPRIGQIVTFLLFSVIGFTMLAMFAWSQLCGVPARVTILHCDHRTSVFERSYPNCVGTPSGAPADQEMSVQGAGVGDEGHDVKVHITGSGATAEATKDGWSWQAVMGFILGVGCGYMTIRAVVRRIRAAPAVSSEST